MKEQQKPRLFVDMDGTLAEWRKIVLKIECEEDRAIVLQKLNQILLTPGYFRTLKPYQNIVDTITNLKNIFDIYVISCVIQKEDTPNPLMEKNEWLNEYLPWIDENHRIFVPDGENKTNYIPNGVQISDFLIDDYTKNLIDFRTAGGQGVKLLNDVNGGYGSWEGHCISKDYTTDEITRTLIRIIKNFEYTNGIVRPYIPEQSKDYILEINKDTNIEELDFERDIFI